MEQVFIVILKDFDNVNSVVGVFSTEEKAINRIKAGDYPENYYSIDPVTIDLE